MSQSDEEEFVEIEGWIAVRPDRWDGSLQTSRIYIDGRFPFAQWDKLGWLAQRVTVKFKPIKGEKNEEA